MSAVALLLAAGSVLLACVLYVRVVSAAEENCARIHGIVRVGGEIIDQGRGDLATYYSDGTITRKQYDREVAKIDTRLRRWRSADCPSPP